MHTDDRSSSMEDEPPKSHIACQACRRRKIRCGRELPHCSVCKQTSIDCEYPAEILKPGPKIGSTHRNRKRRRVEGGNNDGLVVDLDSSPPQEDLGISTSGETISLSRDEDCGNMQRHASVASARSRKASLPKDFGNQDVTSQDSINILDLSFILHPAHEPSTPKKSSSPTLTSNDLEHGKSMIMARASHILSVSPDVLDKMIKIYFDNMTAINLFHKPSFQDKLLSIESPAQTHALLASILAFSARFCAPESQDGYNSSQLAVMYHSPLYFLERALKFIEEALKESGDESPPLCVLQAQILISHCQLTQGVRGKAWRALGTCVRLAYELNLHLVDVERPQQVVDTKQWCENEEKRRAWWAIWEMDVFASTVRRYPTAINWSQIETLLPVEDEYWFQGKPRASCFLELDPIRRWKALQDSGNQSAKAWFLVINSLMKETQSISSPRAISRLDRVDAQRNSAKPNKDQIHAATIADEARDKLETLENCVRCFVMALPNSLKYRNQYLGFDASQPEETLSSRQKDCGLYNIHVMTQLSKLMIYHYGIFSESARTGRTVPRKYRDNSSQASVLGGIRNDESIAMYQYFKAADEILGIVHHSSDDHIQHINAFLASTIWLASAVQLVRKEFGPPETNRSLVKSKFEVLNMTYKKCVSFWGIQTAMQQNLETLEEQLERFRTPTPQRHDRGQPKSDCRSHTKNDSWINPSLKNPQPNSATQGEHGEKLSSSTTRPSGNPNCESDDGIQIQLSRTMPAAHSAPSHELQNDQLRQRQREQQLQPQRQHVQEVQVHAEPVIPDLRGLDYMHSPLQTGQELQLLSDMGATVPFSSFVPNQGIFSGARGDLQGLNPDAMQELLFGVYENGSAVEFPSYIDELLSGAYVY